MTVLFDNKIDVSLPCPEATYPTHERGQVDSSTSLRSMLTGTQNTQAYIKTLPFAAADSLLFTFSAGYASRPNIPAFPGELSVPNTNCTRYFYVLVMRDGVKLNRTVLASEYCVEFVCGIPQGSIVGPFKFPIKCVKAVYHVNRTQAAHKTFF